MSARSLALLGAASLALVTVGVGVAHAWEPIDRARPVWRSAAPYRLHTAGSVDLGGFAPTEAEVRRGMDDWTLVACTSLTTSYGGTVSSLPRGGDGVSSIGWLESGWPHDSNAIGVTGPYFSGSRIVEADMQMNGVNFTWTTASGSGSRVNAYSIILHEGGHYYGLGHSADGGATMYYAYSGGIARLNSDDQNGICALYPGSGSDCTTTGCPSGYTCSSGSCSRVMGDGGTCSPCDTGDECSNGVCLGYPDGNGYCGQNCTTNADCGGDICLAISGLSNQCVRARGSSADCSASSSGCRTDSDCSASERCNPVTAECIPRGTGGALGAACGGSLDCSSGVCFNGACSQSCNWLDPTSCPGAFYCNGQATGTCGAGLCMAGSAGGGALGAACSTATECQSLFCAEGFCSAPCIPGGATSCPDGTLCQAGVAAGCGSCQQSKSLGDACATNEECSSRMCAMTSETSFCTTYCDAAQPCPADFTCTPIDATASVCVPNNGGLGAACTTHEECRSGICATAGDSSTCTRTCGASDPCPRDYDCLLTADGVTSVCQLRDAPPPSMPPSSSGGCGRCTVGGSADSPLTWAVLAMLGVMVRLRRRAR